MKAAPGRAIARFLRFLRETWSGTWGKISVVMLAVLLILFVYQLFRPLNVLDDWEIQTSGATEYTVINGVRMPVYNPGDSLVFTSTSKKVAEAQGTTTRMIVCESTETQETREIQLDTLPATRPTGVNAKRENAIIIPDVAQFDGLPRICRLVIDIGYQNVALWRNHTEHAETERFVVEERRLDAKAIEDEIKRLNEEIENLKTQANSLKTSSVTIAGPTQPSQPRTTARLSPTPPAVNPQPSTQAPTPWQNGRDVPTETRPEPITGVPLLDGVIRGLGLGS